MNPFLITILYLLLLALLAHPIGQALPRGWFRPERRPFAPWGWERGGAIYEKLKIKAWKDRVPDMSKISGDMVKKQVSLRGPSEETYKVIRETCVAEIIHGAEFFLSLPVFFFGLPLWGALAVYLIYNLLGNLPFLLIQRYNRPRLMALYKKQKQREERR